MASILIVAILLAGLQPLLAVPIAPTSGPTATLAAGAATKEEVVAASNSIAASNDIKQPVELASAKTLPPRPLPTLTAEKVRRGLASFINQGQNPGNFFVPKLTPQQQQLQQQHHNQHHHHKAQHKQQVPGQKGNAQVAAEPATIINVDPTAEAIIKGPNRSSTRAIGGPLRWGRRR